MKKILLLAFSLAAACVSALAGPPRTWSAFVYQWNGLKAQAATDTFTPEIAAFTPDAPIVVTRIEMVATNGPFNPAGPSGPAACTTNPSLTIQGDKTTYTLPMATPQNLATLGILHSDTDSGPLRLEFPAGTRITLTANQGDANCFGSGLVNITVQYQRADRRDHQ